MADPTQIMQQQVGFAPEVAPYAQDLLGRAGAMMDLPYQPYTGEQVAQFSPLQQQSYDYAQQMQSAPQLQDATALAGLAGLGGLNAQYTFNPYQSQSATGAGVAQQYMSPYMQNVVDVQMQQAKRQADIAAQTQQAQAARSGAFGGGRDAVMRSLGQAELQRNLQGIQATGLQNAYQQAMQQFNTEQQQRQQAAQLNAQQQQFGSSLGMQGLQTALQGAGQLGNLGQTQYAQNVGLIGLQNQLGLQQQQQAQNVLNTQYQNYLTQQNYPYKQMGFMSDVLRGVPLTTTGSTVYQAAPTMMQNLTSLGLGAYGLSSLFGGSGSGQAAKAAGGAIKGYAGGGSVTSREFKEYAVDNVPSQLLPVVQRNAQARADRDTYMAAIDKMAEDAAIRRGIAGALPAGVNVVRAAGGGIVAFNGENESLVSSEGENLTAQNAGMGFGTDADLAQAMMYANARPGSTVESGDAVSQAALWPEIKRLIGRGTSDEGYTPATAEERQRAVQANVEQQRSDMGPDIYAPMQKRLAEDEAARAGTLQQSRGLAALKAAAAVLQPGGFMRGLGAAGAAFGESYGKALEADRAEKRYINQMQFHLADARRKEQMGLYKDARQDVRDAEAAKLSAFRARQAADINAARALAAYSSSIRPLKVTGPAAEKAPKEYEAGPAAYLGQIKEMYPDMTPAQQKAMAFQMYQERKSAGLAGVTTKVEAGAEEKARERAAKRALTDPTLNAALRKKDSAAADARRKAILQEEMGKPVSEPAATAAPGTAANPIKIPK